MKKLLLLSGFMISIQLISLSQEFQKEDELLFKKTLVKRIDLREKQNEPLFSKGNEISMLLISAVKNGTLTAYKDGLMDSTLSLEEFMEKLKLPEIEVDCFDCEEGVMMEVDYLLPKDLYLIDLKEEIVFNKDLSREEHRIKSFNLFFSADHPENIRGIDMLIASFDYEELKNNVFRNNANAIWYNPYNDNEHLNLVDAFELQLYHGYLIKVSNPNDAYLVDMYGGDPKIGMMASQWKAFEMLEYEHNLWEF